MFGDKFVLNALLNDVPNWYVSIIDGVTLYFRLAWQSPVMMGQQMNPLMEVMDNYGFSMRVTDMEIKEEISNYDVFFNKQAEGIVADNVQEEPSTSHSSMIVLVTIHTISLTLCESKLNFSLG